MYYRPAPQHTGMQSHPGTDQAEALLAASPAEQALAPAVLVKKQQQLRSAGRQAVAPQLQRRRALHTRHTWLVSELTPTTSMASQGEAEVGLVTLTGGSRGRGNAASADAQQGSTWLGLCALRAQIGRLQGLCRNNQTSHLPP